ncbi:MAG: hypothetical protein WCJ35_14720 [Planctomycetota bacterium]
MAEKPEVNKSQSIRDYFSANPKAKPSEVVEALAKQGITVTANLVNLVKSKHNKRHKAMKAATSQTVAETKKPEVNKTQAVRDYFKANKDAKNQEVVDALAKQGISISANYVGNIKASHNKRGQVVKKVVAKGNIGLTEIKAALIFLKLMGGIKEATEALAAAQEIREIV